MLEDSNGTYKQTDLEEFPGYEYFYNNTKSGCMSSSGSIIPDSLLYDQDNKRATVKVTSSSKCYLYFDKYREVSTLSEYLIENANLWQSGLEGDGYRYIGGSATCSYDNGNYTRNTYPECPVSYKYIRTTVSDGTTSESYGTTCPSDTDTYTYSCTELEGTLVDDGNYPKNFVCFGTVDKKECVNNLEKYMYRIIGVFSDANGKQHVKLIKYKQLDKYAWNSDASIDVTWENSDLYKGLNGEYFLTNSGFDYLQNNTWLNKIANWTWSAANAKTYDDKENNVYYSRSTSKGVYLNEMHIQTTDALCANYSNNAINCNGGEWTNPRAKIGIMYVSDCALSNGNILSTLNSQFKGWASAYRNDTTKLKIEWFLSRSGKNSDYYAAYCTNARHSLINSDVSSLKAVRPVFYLNSNEKLSVGTGNINDPYILTTEDVSNNLKVTLSRNNNTLKANIIKGNGNLKKYCLNNTLSINDCEWKPISSTTVTYTMTDYGTYYVHVIDDQGFIAHSHLNYELLNLSNHLIANANLWQSGLEGDGYRFIGVGGKCSYKYGSIDYIGAIDTSSSTCPTMYFIQQTDSSGNSTDSYFATSCPSNTSSYTYSCTTLESTIVDDSNLPNNYICFGTTDKSECIKNTDKYMYRILGIFSDENGNQHAKLIKAKYISNQLEWYSSSTSSISWENSNIYKGLNGNYFLTNTSYDYLQNENWLNKITDWTWSAASTETAYGGITYSNIYANQVYLHEMNRSSKTSTVGEWTTPTAKIGIMYVSDYLLTIGEDSFHYDAYYNTFRYLNSWVSSKWYDNYESNYGPEWLMGVYGFRYMQNLNLGYHAYDILANGRLYFHAIQYSWITRPVFYLTTDVKITPNSTGTLEDPYIIN